jgi:hypothetical protein
VISNVCIPENNHPCSGRKARRTTIILSGMAGRPDEFEIVRAVLTRQRRMELDFDTAWRWRSRLLRL